MEQQNNLALINGKVITVDKQDRIVEAILITGDRIFALGNNEEIKKLIPQNCKIIDLKGKSVIPGLIDSHTHLELTVNHLTNAVNVQVPPYKTLGQILNEINKECLKVRKGDWVIARSSFGMQTKIEEQRLPTRRELDLISTEHPIVIFSGFHISVLNTLALEKMGWDHETSLPKGSSLGRDSNTGELTGVVTEAWSSLPLSPWPYEQLVSTLKTGTIKHFVSRGVTSVHELPFSSEGISAWQDLYKEGNLPLRLRLYLEHPKLIDLEHITELGLKKGFGDRWISIGGVKLFADGTAYHANGYPIEDLKWSQGELNDLVYNAHKSGLQIWTHVLTPTGAKRTITAYENALEQLGDLNHRHRMEHAGDTYDEELLNRLYKSNVIPITTPQFIYSIQRKNKYMRLRSLINKGFILPGNTDSTGTQPESCDPWHSIWCCVKRENVLGEILLHEERITPMEAIKMFTYWAAWGGFEENIKGSLEPGKLADLVVTGEDPLTCDVDALRNMPVELVLVGGEVKYTSNEHI